MGLFGKVFKKNEHHSKKHFPKGFFKIPVAEVVKVTDKCVKVVFDIPADLKDKFSYKPGQYINIIEEIDGNDERRSYSICSGTDEKLAIAIKAVGQGTMSVWANEHLHPNMVLKISAPEGNFTLNDEKNIVSFSAGSGITPIMSIAKSIEKSGGKMHLFFGNKTEKEIIFRDEISALKNTSTSFSLSQEVKEGFGQGRLTKEKISEIIKNDLNLLKADGFYICGPEEMVFAAKEILEVFGVDKSKIHFELFTTPVANADENKVNSEANFSGVSKVKVILDDEVVNFELKTGGKSILDAVSNEGFDPPYSCKGGVCCSCKAKVLEGKATMTLNYSLTDQELADGYILTCQAHPASETITISYDD
jgi:ring-1,2-phenylacetyl-CoA epoxidase subunit PaaE